MFINLLSMHVLSTLTACDSDKGIKAYNMDPNVTISSHAFGAEVQENVATTFIAQTSDGNHTEEELLAKWIAYNSDGEETASCDWATPDQDGVTECILALSGDTTRLVVNVKDPVDASGSDEIDITILEDAPPTAIITNPFDNETYYSEDTISFQAQVYDLEDSLDELQLTWNSSIDGDLPFTSTIDSSGNTDGAYQLSTGDHSIKLTVTDTAGNTTIDSVNITVMEPNVGPECAITNPEDRAEYDAGTGVFFEGTATDANTSDVLTVAWYSDKDAPVADGVPLSSSTPNSDGSVTFASTALSIDIHTITMVVSDSAGETCTDSILVLILDDEPVEQAPSVSNVQIQPTPAYNDSTLLCSSTIVDPDSSYTTEYVWQNDTTGQVIGANTSSIVLDSTIASPEDVISCTVTATDNVGSSTDSTTVTLENRPPALDSISATPTVATDEDDLTCIATFSDPDGEIFIVSYEWTNTSDSAILSSSDTFSLDPNTVETGDIINCEASVTDGSGASASGNAQVSILNPPFLDGVSLEPDPAYNDSTLTCEANVYDPDGNANTTFSWTINGNAQSASSSSNSSTLILDSSIAMPEDEVICSIETSDGSTTDSQELSITLSNRDPVLSNGAISPSLPETNAIVTCSASVSDVDNESPSPSLSYSWSINGTTIPSAASDTLDLSNEAVVGGDSLNCTITAEDNYGGNDSLTVNTTIVEQGPDPQAVCTVSAQQTNPPFETVTFDGSGSYDDGSIASYSWNLTTQPSGSSESLSSSSGSTTELTTDMAGEYIVELTVTDNDGGSSTAICPVVEAVPEDHLRVEMFWTESGDDMDLWMIEPGQWDAYGCSVFESPLKSDQCYFGKCRASSTTGLNSVDWGITRDGSGGIGYDDDPYLDLDDVSGTGPENINVAEPEANGDSYVIAVHDYPGTSDPTTGNSVTVNVYLDGSLVDTATKTISGENTFNTFFEIDYASGSVTDMYDTCSGGGSSSGGSTGGGYGNDDCHVANDGFCQDGTSSNVYVDSSGDTWDWCDPGTDTTDCNNPQYGGSTSGGTTGGSSSSDDSCQYANDGWCDDSTHWAFDGYDMCDPGTDDTDCSSGGYN